MYISRIYLTALFFALFALGCAGCASRYSVQSDYAAAIRETSQARPAHRTVVLFLIDGLPLRTVQQEFRAGGLPTLHSYFGPGVQVGRAVFPTLTYPNIASILTTQPVDQEPVIGNKMWVGGEMLNFEQPWSASKLNASLQGKTVFSALTSQNRNSVSLSYFFKAGATIHLAADVKAGLAYTGQNYRYLDDKTLAALSQLLRKTAVQKWPDLVFVHLIGVDALSHLHGPYSPEALGYLRSLDGRMGAVLNLLNHGEQQGQEVVTLLTADHGFVEVDHYLELEGPIHRLDPAIRVANESRLMALTFPGGWDGERRAQLLRELAQRPGVGMTVHRSGNQLTIEKAGRTLKMRYVSASCRKTDYGLSIDWADDLGAQEGPAPVYCPENLDESPRPEFFPYFLSGVAAYFHSPYHPDGIVIAGRGVSFSAGTDSHQGSSEFARKFNRGQHGGPTPDEILVPVLAHGARVGMPGQIVPTYELLKFAVSSPVVLRPQKSLAVAQVSSEQVLGTPPISSIEASDFETDAGFQHGLEISTPASYEHLSGKVLNTGQGFDLDSKFGPALGLKWKQFWSRQIGTFLDYGIAFSSFSSSQEVAQGKGVSHSFHLGGAYRFDNGNPIALSFGYAQQSKVVPGAGAADLQIERAWIPELAVATQTKLFSLGFADVLLGGGLAILFPATVSGPSGAADLGFGFKKSVNLTVSQTVGVADVLAFTLGVDQQNQSTNQVDQSMWGLRLGASYGLSFLR